MQDRLKYDEAIKFLFEQLPMYQNIGKSAYKKDLTNTLALCEAIGNPHLKIKTVHVAGTNGKGTVSHLIAFGLQRQGLKTGLYTSPHYKDFRERIKINGKLADKKFIARFVNDNLEVIERIKPSFFEITVAMAFDYFAKKEVDVAVIEVGLGGRLDSTNIITPLLSVITNISLDHTDMLGNTVQEIAGEKAGIIKPKVPVIIGERQSGISKIFEEKARSLGSKIYFAEKSTKLSVIKEGRYEKTIVLDLHPNNQYTIKTDLTAPYHEKNLITAFAAMKLLTTHFVIDFNKITKNFSSFAKEIHYVGRWQIAGKNPLIIFDSAHNEGGLKYAFQKIQGYGQNKLHIVIGMVKDKKVELVFPLFPKDAEYYFAKANIPRGMDALDLQKIAAEYDIHGNVYKNVKSAFTAAKKTASTKDIVLVTGSIFVVAEVL